MDDLSGLSEYRNSIFHLNRVNKGLEGERYELDLAKGGKVEGCVINGRVIDPLKVISGTRNVLNGGDPDFDERFVPHASGYARVGYRPTAVR